MKKLLLSLLSSAYLTFLFAQESHAIKFGKISTEDFKVESPLLDSNVNAIVLSDIGSSEFVENSFSWFNLVFRRHKRIKIINKNGFDAADISILLYTDGLNTERLKTLKAATYNIENGEVVVTSLDNKSSVFEEKINKNIIQKKFTFPNISPGSIVEYSYTIESEFFTNLQSWEFQGAYPCVFSEYNVKIPDFFRYVFLMQGYLSYDVDISNDYSGRYQVRRFNNAGESVKDQFASGNWSAGPQSSGNQPIALNTIIHDKKWAIKNIPAIKEDIFTTTIENHRSKIEFQLAEIRFPQQQPIKVLSDWKTIAKKLNEDEEFGGTYTRSNNWLEDELKLIIKGTQDNYEKAEIIYRYVRDNFSCTNKAGRYMSQSTTLKDIFKSKKGSVSELNLLLISMLRKEKIECNPVLISLRNRGVVHPIYPLMNRFNYIIAEVNIDGSNFYLDASSKKLGFRQLPSSCYNGLGWAILNDNVRQVNLSSDSIVEYKTTSIFIFNDENKKCYGTMKTELGMNESFKKRESQEVNVKESFSRELSKNIIGPFQIDNVEYDSIANYDQPLKIKVDFNFSPEEDIIYINPLFGQEMKSNPFSASKRTYPIEIPYLVKEIISLDMEIPKGYEVEEIPKSVRFFLNETEGVFEYLAIKKPDRIQLRSTLHLKKSVFPQGDYDSLREFFAFAIQKQGEQIVLKKVK